MLARFVKPNVAAAVLRPMTSRLVESRRNASHGSTDLQHGHHDVDHHHHGHHDQSQVIYERLWRNKATLDWLPKPEGNWQEINGKQQAYYNQLLIGGAISLVLAYIYLQAIVVRNSGALTKAPYHLIW